MQLLNSRFEQGVPLEKIHKCLLVLFNTVMKLLYSTVRKECLKIRKKQISKIYRKLNCLRGKSTKSLLTEVIEKYTKVKSFPIC